ncbi:glycosyl hydrolase family 28-related protein [Paenibacillus mesophilus]|uniref:glycosyl hydrolase family 28-related protein n=1 Tax=Paenibacillus mesophilus TaxID=2582849 RepID=UPI00192E329F|nr:glycosyl hydrolase family 28-related protein [Paenibacillus mesophilus]
MGEEYRKGSEQELEGATKELNKEEEGWSGRTMSRRRLLTAIGAAGAALTTMSVLAGQVGEAAKSEKPSVSSAVYGDPEHPLTGDCVLSVTIAELRAEQSPEAGRLYYVTDPGREGPFMYDAADTVTPDNTGTVLVSAAGARFKRRYDGNMHAGWFGAKGDGVTDDTLAVRAALAAARGKTLFFPPGVFKLTDTITVPRNTFVRGSGNSSWYTFGQRRNELPSSILDMENGTVLAFFGNGSQTFSSNHADFQSFTCAVRFESDADGTQLSDLKILSHFRIRDGQGSITTQLTDEHAMFDVGVWIDNADHVKLNRVSVVGYWQKAGLYLDASGRLAATGEYGAIEYATIKDCLFQGKIGMAVLGGDEGNPPDETGFVPPTGDALTEGQFGLSHLFVSDCFFSGTDHHSNGFAAGWQSRIEPDSTPIKIDGFIGSGSPYRINNPRFVNCSIQTRESASIVLDRVIRPTFVNCRAESGPIRATKHTIQPRLIACEFPYSRTNTIYHEIENCQGAYIEPPFRRLGHIILLDYEFQIELRNNGGVIEHRVTKPYALQASARSKDAEALFRYAILEAGWSYKQWTPTPVPGSADDFSKGIFLGEKSFQSKYNLYTSAPIDNAADYQEIEVTVAESRAADTGLWARPGSFSAQAVPYRLANYSTALKIELRNGTGPATNLTANLPNETNGAASLVIRVRGKFYEQAYGMA